MLHFQHYAYTVTPSADSCLQRRRSTHTRPQDASRNSSYVTSLSVVPMLPPLTSVNVPPVPSRRAHVARANWDRKISLPPQLEYQAPAPPRVRRFSHQEPVRRPSQIDLISTSSDDMKRMIGMLEEAAQNEAVQGELFKEGDSFAGPLSPPVLPEEIQLAGSMEQRYRIHCPYTPRGQGPPLSVDYEPKHCWCTRCQIMYRMFRDHDGALASWGKYPCHQF